MSPDQEDTGLTIAGAARRLGVSENAVRQRIKRGSVTANKVDGVWRIPLVDHGDQEPDHQATMRSDQESDQEATTRPAVVSPEARSQLEAIRDEWLTPLVTRIEDLSRDLGRVGQERDQLRAEVERLRADHADAATRHDAPGREEPGDGGHERRPWWRRWLARG